VGRSGLKRSIKHAQTKFGRSILLLNAQIRLPEQKQGLAPPPERSCKVSIDYGNKASAANARLRKDSYDWLKESRVPQMRRINVINGVDILARPFPSGNTVTHMINQEA